MTTDDERRRELAASATALAGRVAELSVQLATQNENVARLTKRNNELSKRSKKHSYWLYGTIAGLVLDLALSIIAGILIWQVQDVIGRQDEERHVVHCPFYALVLGSYNPNSRKEGPDRAAYEAAFAQMRKSYEYLQCGPVVPPAAPR